jgi:hypothetical protein
MWCIYLLACVADLDLSMLALLPLPSPSPPQNQVVVGDPDVDGFRLKVVDTCGLEDPEAGDTVNYMVSLMLWQG